MIRVDWSEVEAGDIVLSVKDGRHWIVLERDGIQSTITCEGAKEITGSFSGPVDLVSSAREQRTAAVATLADAGLASQVLHIQNGDNPPLCPPEYDHPGALMSHLYLLHGVRFDATVPESSLRELDALHTAAHDRKNDGYVKHHHDPKFRAVNNV